MAEATERKSRRRNGSNGNRPQVHDDDGGLNGESLNQLLELATNSAIASRAKLSSALGMSFGTDRDVYKAAGYPTDITYAKFEARYKRQDIAKRLINALPDATWRMRPEITETEGKERETAFESDLDKAFGRKRLRPFHYFRRVDRLAGVGRYAILFLGLDDGEDLAKPVEKAGELLYFQVFSENNATINNFVSDKSDERFGLPDKYKINFNRGDTSSEGLLVDASRCIHVADDTVESDVYGTPRLEAVYNRLADLEEIMAGTKEAYWQSGFYGLALEAPAGAKLQDEDALEDELTEYFHGLRRFLRLKGIEAKPLKGEAPKPKEIVEVELMFVSAASGIPLRILTGSERGELASIKDDANWRDRVDERRTNFAEPMILREVIDRLVEVGVISTPAEEDYIVDWPDLAEADPKDKADVSNITTEAMAKYMDKSVDQIMPPMHFLTKVMGYSDDEAEAILKEAHDLLEDEERENEELEKELARRLAEEQIQSKPGADPSPAPVPQPVPVVKKKAAANRKKK